MTSLSDLTAEQLADYARAAIAGTGPTERGYWAVRELVRRASERDEARQALTQEEAK